MLVFGICSGDLRWRLMADDRELATGEARVNALPHSTGTFTQPLDAIKAMEPGVTYYTHLAFLRPDGSEIVRHAVELPVNGPSVEAAPAIQSQLRVRRGKTITVSAGAASYEFDPASARLVSASMGGDALLTGSRFTIWRPLNPNDLILPLRIRPADIPDLNKYTTTVRSWKIGESTASVRIEAEADHQVNERNSFSTSFTYEIGRDGALRVEYSVRPRVEVQWLPEIGMELETAPGLDNLRWLGLGPLDAYPNEKTAPILGVYAGRVGSDTAKGVKAIRWAELTSDHRVGVRVEGSPYVRAGGRALRVLPSVGGRSEKNRRPENPEYRLDAAPPASFVGSFSIHLVARERKR